MGEIVLDKCFLEAAVNQILEAKVLWYDTEDAQKSLSSTLCALQKLDRPQLYQLDSYLQQRYSVLHKRHTIFNTSDAFEFEEKDIMDHWVCEFYVKC